jgi:hypothetical protein
LPLESAVEYVVMRVMRIATGAHLRGILHLFSQRGRFMDYFVGFEHNAAVRGIFGEGTAEVLMNLEVDFIWFGYMGVDDGDGHLMVNKRYLSTGDREEVYLDVVHELCHVKQHMDGKELFDPQYDYVDRPTEVEAYRYAVLEARRIGFSDGRIRAYLRTEWMSADDLDRLIRNMGVELKEV